MLSLNDGIILIRSRHAVWDSTAEREHSQDPGWTWSKASQLAVAVFVPSVRCLSRLWL